MNKDALGSTLRRRDEILRVIREQAVKSQGGLMRVLRGRGFRVAQPTLSRDLAELRLAKTPAGYVLPPAGLPVPGQPDATAAGTLDRALKDYVLSAERAGSLVVVRTLPAEANPLARAIDAARVPGVVGTVAGDDTIFVATQSPSAAGRVQARLLAPVDPAARRARRRG